MTTPNLSTGTPELLDREDIALQASLVDMQSIVTQQLLRLGLPISDLTAESQQILVDRVTPYLRFELAKAEGIWVGAPIVVEGPGGILAADSEGNICGVQDMRDGDTVTGIVDDASVLPVPSLECMRTPDDITQDIATYDQSFSAVIMLQNAQFSTTGASGTQVVHDLSHLNILVPVVYGMQTTMSPIAEL